MKHTAVISSIKEIAGKTLPANRTLLLYGSRARGDNRPDSDWDLLILLDKPKLSSQDYDYGYPFRELGWDIGEEISPHIYTKKQWSEWTYIKTGILPKEYGQLYNQLQTMREESDYNCPMM